MSRPTRQRRADRLTEPDASNVEVQRIHHAIAPLDRLAAKMDRKWGIDRLPELVSPETAAKYGSAMAKLNAAIDANDFDETLKRVGVCQRGLAAMNLEAEALGAEEADPAIWEYDLDGWRFGIMDDGRQWQAAATKRPDLELFTMREAAVALRASKTAVVDRIKEEFPGARITDVRNPSKKVPDDDIPF